MRTILTLAIWLSASLCFAQAQAVIVGPDNVNPGDLVILDGSESTADSREWILVGSDKQFLVFEDGRKLVFASGSPGSYTFVLAVAQSENNVATISLAKHVVTVVGPQPVPPVPPGPGPGPGPGPVPPVPPEPDLSGVAKEAYELASKVVAHADELTGLANALRSISGKAAGLGWTVEQINQEFAVQVKPIFHRADAKDRWKSFNAWQIEKIKAAAGSPQSLIDLFADVATGLDAVPRPAPSPQSGPTTTDSVNDGLRSRVESLKSDVQSLEREIRD